MASGSRYVPRVHEFIQSQLVPPLIAAAFNGERTSSHPQSPLDVAAALLQAADIVLARCESPIEQLVAAAFMARWGFEAAVVMQRFATEGGSGVTHQDRTTAGGGYEVIALEQQFTINAPLAARLDFVVHPYVGRTWRIAIECDGHDFHERTAEQAERDRSRDRALTATGWSVLRFTGREIWRDPFAVVADTDATIDRLCPGRQP